MPGLHHRYVRAEIAAQQEIGAVCANALRHFRQRLFNAGIGIAWRRVDEAGRDRGDETLKSRAASCRADARMQAKGEIDQQAGQQQRCGIQEEPVVASSRSGHLLTIERRARGAHPICASAPDAEGFQSALAPTFTPWWQETQPKDLNKA